jgi:hypothetical protein
LVALTQSLNLTIIGQDSAVITGAFFLATGSRMAMANGQSLYPDPNVPGLAREPFESGVAWGSAWWWLVFPFAVAAVILYVGLTNPEFYIAYIINEPYGALEFLHFAFPFFAFVIGLTLLFKSAVRRRPLLLAFIFLATIACLYLAGEEVSWGQHFFKWATPEGWENRQNETNLHNTYWVLEKFPRIMLETGIFIGVLLIPLAAAFNEQIRRARLAIFFPAAIMVPTALCAMGFKAIHTRINDVRVFGDTIPRPSEAAETFYVMFLLFFMIVLARRVRLLQSTDAA